MQPFLRFVVALFLSAFFIFGFVVVETFTFLGVVANAFIVTFICKEIAKKFFDNLTRRQQIAIAYFLSLGVLTAMFFMHSFGNNPEFMAKILFVYLPTVSDVSPPRLFIDSRKDFSWRRSTPIHEAKCR